MNSAEIGSINLSNEKIRETPVIFGESDVIKTLQLEPGVTSGIEGMANMYVHGGDTDENMYMLDNIPLYQVNHLGGLFSAFNTGAIRNADFYKSSFPAKYDGRLSSYLDVHTKDGNPERHQGSVALGLTRKRHLAADRPVDSGHRRQQASDGRQDRRRNLLYDARQAVYRIGRRLLEMDGQSS